MNSNTKILQHHDPPKPPSKPPSDSESTRSQIRPTSRLRLLKRKKSESASTSAAVAFSEDTNRTIGKLFDCGAISGARPFNVPRRSRPKLEDQHPSRSHRELSFRETVRKTTYGSNGELARRENTPDIVVTDQSRRDKGKAVTGHIPSTRRPLSESSTHADSECSDKLALSSQVARAEFERMKKEIDFWKKAAADNRKQAKKQTKKVEELKAQVLRETLVKKEQETQVKTLRGKIEEKEELITVIETSLQCQICMDLIHRPYALSPCGHILCLYCLQGWFRKAPPAPGDDDVDPDEFEDDSSYILNRTKSCPCCRTVITQRPIPVFVVKAIATALLKHRATVEPGTSIRNRSPSPNSEDPWKGLFNSTDDDDVDSDQSSEEDEAFQDAMGWNLRLGLRGQFGHQLLEALEEDFESETGSESEVGEGLEIEDEQDTDGDGDGDSVNFWEFDEYESVYVPARWEPPGVIVVPEMYGNQGMAASILRMLSRGCTIDMINLFKITYSHDQGLVAHLPSLDDDFAESSHVVVQRTNRVFLGWNVHLDLEDYTGELYMRGVLIDIRENPEKWLWTQRAYCPGAFDVKLLLRAEEVEHYDTTDTEYWLDNDLHD